MLTTPEGFVRISEETAERLAYEATLDEDSCCSFQEWSAAGYTVKKGTRSVFRDIMNVPQFTKEQVVSEQKRQPT